MQEFNIDFDSIGMSPKPSGAAMCKVPVQIVKEFEHQQGKTSAPSTFWLHSIRSSLNAT